MYFYQIKCCFYTQNGCMNKTILQRLIPSQIPVSYVVNFINFINITLIYHITKQRVCETVSII
jgi:hypothetical protein